MLFDKVIAYDHLRQKIAIVVNMKNRPVLENYGRAVEEIDRIARLIAGPVSLPPLSGEHAARRHLFPRDGRTALRRPSGAGQRVYPGRGHFPGGAVPPVRYPVQGQPA